jgi:hypothetical protein
MSNVDEISIHVEEIVAGLVAAGLRDPAWIANAYIERIEFPPQIAGSDQRRLRCLCSARRLPTARDCRAKGLCTFEACPLG